MRIRGMVAALLPGVVCCVAAPLAWALDDGPAVAAASPYMQSLAASPMPPAFFDQLVIREIYLEARDVTGATALQHYMDEEALTKLEGGEWTPASSVKDAIANAPKAASIARDRLDRVLAGAAQVDMILPGPDADSALAKNNKMATYSSIAPGLWKGEINGRPIGIRAVFRLRNTSHTGISAVYPMVAFGDKTLTHRMSCTFAEQGFLHKIEPDDSALYVCSFYAGQQAQIDRITAAWSAGGEAGPRLDINQVVFDNPAVTIARYTTAIQWAEMQRARLKAETDLGAVSCHVRQACLEDFKRKIWSSNPLFYVPAMLILLGVIGGWFVGRFAQRPGRVLLRCFLVMCALVILAAGSALAWGMSDWMLVMIVVAVAGLVIAAVIMVGMLLGWAIGQSMRK